MEKATKHFMTRVMSKHGDVRGYFLGYARPGKLTVCELENDP